MVNFSINNQYITYEEFKNFAQIFLKKSKELNYKWEWIENLGSENKKGFLKLIQYSEISKDNLDSQKFKTENDEIIENIISKQELNEFDCQFEDVYNYLKFFLYT